MSQLAEVMRLPSHDDAPRQRKLDLALERQLEVEGGGRVLRVRGPHGDVELQVCITPEGPLLRFASVAIEVAHTQALTLDAQTLSLRARDVHIEAGRHLTQTVAGDATLHCEGHHRIEAGQLTAVSHHGAMTLDATHDVALRGERVLLNC